MTRALIADDEAHLALYLKNQLQQLWPELEIVAIARNGIEAAEQIAELQPELAFLDIQMPGLTGLEVAQGIEGATRVIFVTAYDDYAVAAFEHAALDYLLKPLKTERLARTLERVRASLLPATADAAPAAVLEGGLAAALQTLLRGSAGTGSGVVLGAESGAGNLRYVRAAQGDLTHQIPVEEVLYFHADDKYTVVQTARGEHLIRTPIVDLVAQLEPAQFWQVHRSTVINLSHLAGTRRDELSRLFVRFKGHERELPVSRAYVHLFKAM
ncbi:LytTR family DNA-binding domain-containing protein [Paucibacter sp. DJ1R-11]|uniref:LytR/AlgR family response regulator transcription factor n=1 Tax=Paucibacter sp. DJ1R-11 TaxID=2893556 RepID=UPI0021E35A36|nr:LytTR family DNA-binding domain-containing protein [Paucibacter sp. DJ1R-11]MCV2365967.1 LytTR family DNA-binding domain-containing protein [Paucibacter sp. DJ1R-11]